MTDDSAVVVAVEVEQFDEFGFRIDDDTPTPPPPTATPANGQLPPTTTTTNLSQSTDSLIADPLNVLVGSSACGESLAAAVAWRDLITQFDFMASCRPHKVRGLAYGGVPHSMRSAVWQQMLGVAVMRDRFPSDYFKSKAAEECSCESQIWLDIPRTFPNHRKLSKGAAGCDDMRDILVAYANHNPNLGYCQGMSYVAGLLLITFESVEDAFWTFLTLMDQHMRGSYDARVSGMVKDGKIFERLLAERLPSLAAHLEHHTIASLLYITPWFMTLFTHISAPWCTVLRIWDVIALEGKSALFRFALALLHLNERELLAADGVEKILPVLLKINPDAEQLLQFAAASMPPVAELVAQIDAAEARVDEAEQERPRLTPTSSIAAFGNGMLSRMMSSLTTPRKNLSAALDKLRNTADFVPTLTPLTTPTTSPSKRRRRGASPPPPQQQKLAPQPPAEPQQPAQQPVQQPVPAATSTPSAPPPINGATTSESATVSFETRESFRAFSTSSPTPKRKHFSAIHTESPRAASTPPKTVVVQVVSPEAPETDPEELVDLSKRRRALRRTVATKQLVKSRLVGDDSQQLTPPRQHKQPESTPSPSRRALLSPGSAGKKRKPDEISLPR